MEIVMRGIPFLGMLFALLMLNTVAPVAQASPELAVVQCVAGGSSAYSPGLTMTARPIDITGEGTFNTCLGDSAVSGGTYTFTAHSDSLACTLGDATSTVKINWLPLNVTSTVDLAIARSVRPGGETAAVITGTITAGRYVGASYTSLAVIVNPAAGACLSDPGVVSSTGTGTITILKA
ncbi:hypothetical protein M8C13_32300 [Crossiella sp. SN42]|uniref:hypothetical protein n=1 Tax=Crossiella sp. SN42 TaxID=2944808 RepID=UPI00207D1CB8|nr:hypothetical protein [Crossiella sp. SN42]MCO1580446.1 hypothetical protein [Crossiella sp. SN42]